MERSRSKQQRLIVFTVLLLLFTLLLLKNAWLSDDAYITFRTIDNFVDGYGLRYNIAERVQTYTHPLWMFLLTVCYVFTNEIYYTGIFLSIAVSLAAAILILVSTPERKWGVLALVALASSKAYIDYSTSGLENPLSHLLFVVFIVHFLKSKPSTRSLLLLSVVTAFAALNRPDTILVYLPAIIFFSWQVRGKRKFTTLLLGFSPLILWEVFSLFYYGFPFPNTAYAKLGTGVATGDLMVQGLYYLWQSFTADPLTLTVIVLSLIAALYRRERRTLLIASGILLYLLYIIKIGGDFMSGRFLALPLLAAVLLLTRLPVSLGKKKIVLLLILLLALGLVPGERHLLSWRDYGSEPLDFIDEKGVSDERGFYFQATGLFSNNQIGRPDHHWVHDATVHRRGGKTVGIKDNLGFFGFYAGRQVHLFDLLGLADPLLARLPAMKTDQWRIGHFPRGLPEGYMETLKRERNLITDPDLAAYYDKLALVTRGELLSSQRLKEIWNLNIGRYDHLKGAYKKAAGI